MTLEVRLWVVFDRYSTYLRAKESRFRVVPAGKNRPVFRYEYDQEMERGNRPAAHLQVHGSHPDLQGMLQSSGRPRTRSSQRGSGIPDITDLHFPLGGTRFRPCLEDVLEMLIEEFNIDPVPDKQTALAALRTGRADWRETQLRALVRDSPETAIDVLERMGYTIAQENASVSPPLRNHRSFERL